MPIATCSSGFCSASPSPWSNVLSDPQSLFSVEGLVAVVTGGGTGACYPRSSDPVLAGDFVCLPLANQRSCTGIGLMIAKALEANGAIVYIVSRRLDTLEAAAREHSVSVDPPGVGEPEAGSHGDLRQRLL